MLTPDPWRDLRRISQARIALGRAGGSLPTQELLDFAQAHAEARDAVQMPFAADDLAARIAELGGPVLLASTQAGDRKAYLTRPDWGRRFSPESRARLQSLQATLNATAEPLDLVIVVSDGLSALAAERQVLPLLAPLLTALREAGWRLAPILVVPFARVALQDEAGELLQSCLALSLLGERPGLLAPDSLGAYFVHAPRVGNSDANRNCISNIRPEGLAPDRAAQTLFRLLSAARDRRLSGVALKDDEPILPAPPAQGTLHGS